jgi:2-dehydropantoate 2-reductase
LSLTRSFGRTNILSSTNRAGFVKARPVARIAIVGPGAIGGVIAAWLSYTGKHEVFLCARRPLAGLKVETPNRTIEINPTVWTDPQSAAPVDWVLVATKTYQAEAAAAWFAKLASSGASVAVLQNGVEHRERFSKFLPSERIVPVIVECPAERSEPGLIRQRGAARLIVLAGDRGRSFADLFAGTEIELVLTSDFLSPAWAKLCLNCAGALNAILLQPSGVMRDESVAEAARQLVRECIAVGRAEGAVLGDELANTVVEHYRRQPPDSVNSLLADRMAGRPMEFDARNGVIVRLGRKHGIAAPCNQLVVAVLQAMEKAR